MAKQLRIRDHSLLPGRWFVTGIHETAPHDAFGPSEYRFAMLRLPIWQWGFKPWSCDYGWLQLALSYHGKHGFTFHWPEALPQ